MMSRASSDSSLEEQESTVSSKSTPRKSLDQHILQGRNMSRELHSDIEDMPSLSSFRADDLTSSGRGDCDMSLPSLSSFRIDDLSMGSSYHSNTNHLSESGSAEGWASFNSGNVSTDTTDDSAEFASSPPSGTPDTDREIPRRTDSLPVPRRSRSPGCLTVRAAEDAEIHTAVNPRPSAGVPVIEQNIEPSSGLPRRPRRAASPPQAERSESPLPVEYPPPVVCNAPVVKSSPPRAEWSHHIEGERKCARGEKSPHQTEILPPRTERPFDSEAANSGASRNAPKCPARRPSSPTRTPLERSGSLPLSNLARSSSPVQEGSSSSLRGGDSLPRLPRRTSTIEDSQKPSDNDESAAKELQDPIESKDVTESKDVAESNQTSDSKNEKPPFGNRKSPTSVRSIEQTIPTKGANPGSSNAGNSSAEETASSATEAEEEDAGGDKEEKKRGGLKKLMSNSFKSIGRASSFRNSFRMLGKTASQLKRIGRREDKPSHDAQEKTQLSPRNPRQALVKSNEP